MGKKKVGSLITGTRDGMTGLAGAEIIGRMDGEG